MCRFCEGQTTMGREGRKVFMNDDKQLVYLGNHSLFGDVIAPINFCPMCGSKLFNDDEANEK